MRLQVPSFAVATVLAVLIAGATLIGAQSSAGRKVENDGKKAVSESSLSGCIDQQDGRYVLINERSLETMADLDADGFPTEGFAKHVGHRVTVRGKSNPGSTHPVFKVRSIETISESCEPRPQSDKK
jgi:hypothetical protein